MKDTLNTETVRQMLNRSSAKLDYPAQEKLRGAREKALMRYDARAAAPAFAWAGALGWADHGAHRSHYFWASVVLLAALLFSGASYWQQMNEHDSSDEVDIAILTDELPIDVYVD